MTAQVAQEPGLLTGWAAQFEGYAGLSVDSTDDPGPSLLSSPATCLRLGIPHLTGPELPALGTRLRSANEPHLRAGLAT